jgi:tight adherence protein B
MTGLLAGAAAAGATALLLPGVLAPRTRTGDSGPTRPAAVAALIGGVASLVLLDGRRVVLALVGLAAAVAVSRELARRRRRLVADRRAEQVLAMCEALASELRAGQPPVTALASAVEDWRELAPVTAAAALGADVPAALRDLGRLPGAGQVRIVAAAWQVAHRSGAGLSGALAMAAERLRSERATARVVATEMAAAQATARLLAVLPIGVLLLGSGLGGDPFGFLLDTTAGLVCLSCGLALEYAGLSWLARIADQVVGRR